MTEVREVVVVVVGLREIARELQLVELHTDAVQTQEALGLARLLRVEAAPAHEGGQRGHHVRRAVAEARGQQAHGRGAHIQRAFQQRGGEQHLPERSFRFYSLLFCITYR